MAPLIHPSDLRNLSELERTAFGPPFFTLRHSRRSDLPVGARQVLTSACDLSIPVVTERYLNIAAVSPAESWARGLCGLAQDGKTLNETTYAIRSS
jgi:hypothetical protein